MKKDVIKETLSFKELTQEEKDARGILGRLYGPCADFINPTRNGRYYNDELWEKVFNENELVKEAFENGGIPGELDHPEGREDIDSSKIAIIMPEAPKRDENGHLIAYFDILDTPNGRIAYQLAKYGYKLGISSRGTGDVIGDEVDPDTYEFKCFDLVLTPSVKAARLSMTESLDTKQNQLRQALTESLNNSNDDDKRIMQETLDRLNISLDEAKLDESEEEAVVDDVEAEATEEVVENEPEATETEETVADNSYNGKIKEFLALVYDGETAPTDEETNAFVDAFKAIFPEECFNLEGCADIESETSEETINEPEEANDEGSEELIKSLQDALTTKSELEGTIKQLQEQLAVSDTKVKKLEVENSRYKSSVISLSEAAHDSKDLRDKVNSLEEELKIKDSNIQELVKNKESANQSLTESISSKDAKINSLNEDLKKQKADYDSQVKQLNEKLEVSENEVKSKTKLVEQWQAFSRKTIDRYINTKATMFGVEANVIKGKLPKKYDIDDVDRICESLQDDSLSVRNLPFELGSNKSKIAKVQIVESRNDNLSIPSNYDDNVDTGLLDLAESIKNKNNN